MGGDALFVGRALELGMLDARLERAIAGAGSLVMVVGDAGMAAALAGFFARHPLPAAAAR
jgi:hypothetical protein